MNKNTRKYNSYLYDLIVYLKMNPKSFAESLGFKRVDRIYNVLNGVNGISPDLAKIISDVYNEVNYEWLLAGEGEMLRDGFQEAKPLKEVKQKKYTTTLEVKIVTMKARAGFSDSYYADEYLEDMPTVLIEADREYKGNYLAFEVDGDSMEPEYNKGDVVICREVKRDLWKYKLHYKDYDFIIAHGTKGIMLKEITSHDPETGEITCHSLNNENGKNKDFTLNLKEVAFLYNVVEHRISGKSKRRNR